MIPYTEYEVWHDETKKGAYYHGLLFIPLDKKDKIIDYLKKIRNEHNREYNEHIKFAGALNSTKRGRMIKNHLRLFSHIIMTNPKCNGTKLYNRTGKDKFEKNFEHFCIIDEYFGCRFGLLKVKDLESTLDYFSNYRKKVETTYRFIIKGCCHGMFDRQNPIRISKLYFDGNGHYDNNLDVNRLTKGNWRNYCKIPDNLPVDDRDMKYRDTDSKLIMAFVDNVVGAFRAKLNGEKDNNMILCPLDDIFDRIFNEKIFKNYNSRWYKSISLSEFKITKDENIEFPDIMRNERQLSIFDIY